MTGRAGRSRDGRRPAERERPLISPAVSSLARELYVAAVLKADAIGNPVESDRLADGALESARAFGRALKRRAEQLKTEKEGSSR